MSIDDVQEIIEPVLTLNDRVSRIPKPIPIDLTTQYLGNRVRRTFYPEHWARVQIARHTAHRYGGPDEAHGD